MRVLAAIVHFAEQVLLGDKREVSVEERNRALTELKSLEETYLQYWSGGKRPGHFPEHSDIFFKTIYNAFESISKTNASLNPEVLAFRLDVSVLDGHQYPKRPWALFFFWSESFFAFHIRFQEIARGGLRTVIPRRQELEEQESRQIFCECYDLAYTQELKNKDIPEGGAKGVIFVQYAFKAELVNIQKKCIKAFLQLLVPGLLRDMPSPLFDRELHSEWVFLGPDERMSDPVLDWIGAYSKQVGYSLGAAFMSSRPDGGINHKQYGVTSFGLMVYIEESLKAVGIDPSLLKFRIKLSGGPDGDVAGNTLKLLSERYPKTASVIALKDVSGLLYDPMGISFEALLPLVEKGLPIASIDIEKLHPGSFLLDMRKEPLFIRVSDKDTRSEIFDKTAAETLFDTFLHRVQADLFVPAGGRRASLRIENIADFMPDGIPSARIIVEGANVYLTQAARDVLESSGVLIIKDSSANKGGVICSSYEVETLLTIGEAGLKENRSEIVRDILDKIAKLCRFEAHLLFEERKLQNRQCSVLSYELSISIQSLTAELLTWVQNWESPLYRACIERHFLPILIRLGPDSLMQLPISYLQATAACFIASRFVYRYGTKFPYEIRADRLDQMAQAALDFEPLENS